MNNEIIFPSRMKNQVQEVEAWVVIITMPKELVGDFDALKFADVDRSVIETLVEDIVVKLGAHLIKADGDTFVYDLFKVNYSRYTMDAHIFDSFKTFADAFSALKKADEMDDNEHNVVSLQICWTDWLMWNITADSMEEAIEKVNGLSGSFGKMRLILEKGEYSRIYETPYCRINMYYNPDKKSKRTLEDRIVAGLCR